MLTMGQLQGFWARYSTDIEYVAKQATYSASETQSATINAPAGIAEGDLLLACLIHEGACSGSFPSCSGWTKGYSDCYNGIVQTVLYKWATSADESAASYTFTHSDSSYGGFGGAILLFRGSIKNGHSPIYRVSEALQTTYTGTSKDQDWNSYGLDCDLPGGIILVFASARSVPAGSSSIGLDIQNVYTELYGLTDFIGGFGSGNCIGGGLAYRKFTEPGTAYDAGANATGDSGASPLSWYESARLYMLI